MAKRRTQRNRSPKTRSTTLGSQGDALYITSAKMLVDACSQIRQAGRFAFDTEFVMEDRFSAEVCVIQLATDSLVVVVDPFEIDDLAPVWSLVADPDIETVVHAGMEDLALCQSQGGQLPQCVFDCQIACGLVTADYPLSLSRMTKNLLGIRLHKSQTLTDWRRRPLSPDQIRYAADDVAHLPAIRRELGERLARSGRSHWADEEMARFCKPDTYSRDTPENIFKLKGAGALDGLGLAIARELVKTRQRIAARFNRPARAVVRDHLILEIAKHRWTTADEIKTLRGLNLRAQGIRDLAEAVERAMKMPQDQWPTPAPPDDETDHEAALAMLIGAVLRVHCADCDIAHPLVASKKDLRALVRHHLRGPSTDGDLPIQTGWRAEACGALLRDVLGGRATIKLRGLDRGLAVIIEQAHD